VRAHAWSRGHAVHYIRGEMEAISVVNTVCRRVVVVPSVCSRARGDLCSCGDRSDGVRAMESVRRR